MHAVTWTDDTGAERAATVPDTAADLTDEMMNLIREAVDGWYPEGKIEWEDVWDRVEGTPLADGTELSMGDELDTPAQRKAQRIIREERRNS